MRLPLMICVTCAASILASHAEPPKRGLGGGKLDSSKPLGEKVAKLALNQKILQVVPEGLLFYTSSGTFLLVGHPKQQTLADGVLVNCYVERTETVMQYTAVSGAMKTARVYKYLNERIGG